MPAAGFADRSLLTVCGADAADFLQGLVTVNVEQLAEDEVRPGALLTPQGKILFDFLISRLPDAGFRLETGRRTAGDFFKRLSLYKLRSKVEIVAEEQAVVCALWETDSGASQSDSTGRLIDRRFPAGAGVLRRYGGETMPVDDVAWAALRVRHGVPEAGIDYQQGDAFPHDALYDQTGGVDMKKGCYVGQEVVSRMHHRGTARRRVLMAAADTPLPAPGTELTANGRPVGALGTVAGTKGLAMVRIDRVKAAMDAGTPVMAGDTPVHLSIPAWAGFSFPTATEEAD